MPKEQKLVSKSIVGTCVVPGDVLHDDNKDEKGGVLVGEGTARVGRRIVATLSGTVELSSGQVMSVENKKSKMPIPFIGAVVLVRVVKVVGSFISVDIFTVAEKQCKTPFRGTIKAEDIKAVASIENAKIVETWRCMKPNDIVRAEIIGMGDRKSYQLSTLRDELGVVYAMSNYGHQLIATSAEEMQCVGTGQTEPRKVALGGNDFWWI
eukprot:TRINITY_DN14701_c0_g1_i1.p1 TRINITY_DN14701_c0_g1~~TRINITY_DN14701_c0_g1_i1.p1  ORF type:complete len:229 (+),score=54.89 TRINITY_DN14701_c0_g1_i1:61-687(+)